jgi:TonB family protein
MNTLHSSLFLPWLLSYLCNALWQIPLVFAAAWIAVLMLRRASPQAEHRVWVAALMLEITLPACSFRPEDLWHALLRLLPARAASNNGGVRVLFGPATTTGSALHIPRAFEVAAALGWACCILYFAARLAWGLWQTHSLSANATRITLTGETALLWSSHCHRLGITAPPPEIAVSPHGIGPVTVGVRRGILLVPSYFLDTVATADLDAVLAHELAHIARHDFAKNLFHGVVSLPIAWHPLLWRTRARVAQSRELVCDALAAEAVDGPGRYARSLLRLASMLSARSAVTLHALGILNFNEDVHALERRVMLLTRKHAPISTARRLVILAACGLIAIATGASALALHIDVSGLNSSTEHANPSKIHVRSDIMSSQKISGDNPKYPEEARAKKIQGAVVLDVIIGKDGVVENIRVQTTPAESLAKSAIEAVRTWRYRPYLLNGDPVEVETTVRVTYNLGG